MIDLNYISIDEVLRRGRVSRRAYDALQSGLSDEEFLIAMGNRLREMELERAAPAAIRWIKHKIFLIREETSLPGLDLKRLLQLAGQEVPDALSNDQLYPASYDQMSRLVAMAGGRETMTPSR